MLIDRPRLQQIAAGHITVAFRRWRSPTVKTGGTLRTAIGVLAIDAVDLVRESDITPADAKAAGYASLEDLLEALRSRTDGALYRIRLRMSGPDPRERLRQSTATSESERQELRDALDRLDSRARHGPWTRGTLNAIGAHPEMHAAEIAALLGFEKEWLKTSIRKLKELGLTESLASGYRLSPRGSAILPEL